LKLLENLDIKCFDEEAIQSFRKYLKNFQEVKEIAEYRQSERYLNLGFNNSPIGFPKI